MTKEDAEVVVVLASSMHDLGISIHRDDHERYSLFLARGKLPYFLDGLYDIRERTIMISEILHAMIAHRSDARCLTLEAGLLKVADALEDHPWSGRILSADEEGVMISAGNDIGVKAESVFEVFARGEAIRSASGRSLFLLGPKVGEVKTVQIMESYAAAVPLGEARFNAGQVIRIKD